jgi:phosphoserine phosphatase RsbU/P
VVAALRADRETEQLSAALVLQRSLMPVIGAPVAGLDVAARYVPAEGELGGDWYDVFTLPDNRLGLVIGDVAGHGLRAAVVMGRLRSALRAYALDADDPAEVLRRLDRKLSHFESGTVATALYAVAAPPYDAVTISSAGHWAPFLVEPGQAASAVDLTSDLMLGTGLDPARTSTTLDLRPGASLCLFTDGLVDRRPRPGRPATTQLEERLEAVRAGLSADDDAETTCTRVLLTALGDEPNEDDTALLVVRRPLR